MKQFLIALFLLCTCASSFAQQKEIKSIPDFQIQTIEQKNISAQELLAENKPLVISFWATYCKPCVSELTEIADQYEDWKEEVDFNLLAISVDDSRSFAKVKSVAYGKDWPFIIGLDPNQAVKRQLNVSIIPQTFVFNAQGELIYQHQGYTPGSELEVLEQLKKISIK